MQLNQVEDFDKLLANVQHFFSSWEGGIIGMQTRCQTATVMLMLASKGGCDPTLPKLLSTQAEGSPTCTMQRPE